MSEKRTTILDWQRAYFRDQADPKLRCTWPSMAVLMTHADRNLECFPSQAKIARAAGIKDPDTVRRHLKANEDAGWLQKLRIGGPGNGTNHYRFVVPSPLQRGDIPATARGAIPAVERSKLSNRTGQVTAQVTVDRTSPLQRGEGQVPIEPKSGSWDISSREHERPKGSSTAGPYPRATAGRVIDVRIAPDTPEQRLLEAIRAEGGSVPAKSLVVADAVGQDANVIIPQMIRDGLIIHDVSTEPARLALAHN